MNKELEQYLQQHDIQYKYHSHPAVFTVAESDIHCGDIPGMRGKNLFLKDKEGTAGFFLLVVPGHKRVKMAMVQKFMGIRKLAFATEQELWQYLHLTPGSVSPFGLIHDMKQEVTVLIDQDIWDAPVVNFHPNVNTASLELSRENFHKFIASLSQKVKILAVPAVDNNL